MLCIVLSLLLLAPLVQPTAATPAENTQINTVPVFRAASDTSLVIGQVEERNYPRSC